MKKYPTTTHQGVSIPLKSLAEQRFESPSLSAINDDALKKICNFFITETYLKCGQAISTNELNEISRLFAEELHIFPYITIKELKKCFSDGYKERYGKYYGLSVKTFIGWIDYYIQNKRNEDLNSLKKSVIKVEEISESEKIRRVNSGMQKCISHFEEHKTILKGYTEMMYLSLIDDGFLNPTDEVKKEFYALAKSEIKTSYQGAKASNRGEHNFIKETLKKVEIVKSPIVIARAKEMILINAMGDIYKIDSKVVELKQNYGL